ncbi:hypothetical protein GZ78_09430 [Endozoicomonas numazuensis]|uniref:Uncharacterized protein n=1 Tax=Endozoicomonas numazuensis TaxID=1137799 RepID=A0A081NHD7_9GAMM|nr:hypothetical protein GZ78_09430 [Endozoicomonas numazuensis]
MFITLLSNHAEVSKRRLLYCVSLDVTSYVRGRFVKTVCQAHDSHSGATEWGVTKHTGSTVPLIKAMIAGRRRRFFASGKYLAKKQNLLSAPCLKLTKLIKQGMRYERDHVL